MDEFLRDTPLVDGHSPGAIIPVQEEWIGFKKAAFTWYQDLPADSTLFNFRLEVNDLVFEKGKVVSLLASAFTRAVGSRLPADTFIFLMFLQTVITGSVSWNAALLSELFF